MTGQDQDRNSDLTDRTHEAPASARLPICRSDGRAATVQIL